VGGWVLAGNDIKSEAKEYVRLSFNNAIDMLLAIINTSSGSIAFN